MKIEFLYLSLLSITHRVEITIVLPLFLGDAFILFFIFFYIITLKVQLLKTTTMRIFKLLTDLFVVRSCNDS